MSTVNFTKVHHSPGKTVIEWFDVDAKGTRHEHALESAEEPDAPLVEAFKRFVPLIAEACDLTESWQTGLTVIGLSFSSEQRKGQAARRGVIVTFQYCPEAFLSRMTVNTSLLKASIAEDDSDEDAPGIIPRSWLEPIAALEEAAAKFIQGARAQTALPLFEAAPVA